MKFRHSGGENEKTEPQMAPMIDVVFQLLIFFMLTLKIIEPEGDFSVNMPQGRPRQTVVHAPQIAPKLVEMKARPDGTLDTLEFARKAYPIRKATDAAQIRRYIELNPKELLTENQAARRIGEDIAFAQVTDAVEKWVRGQRALFPSNHAGKAEFEKKLKIRLRFDYHLHNRYIIKATSACRGKVVKGRDAPLDLVRNIEFVPPSRKAQQPRS